MVDRSTDEGKRGTKFMGNIGEESGLLLVQLLPVFRFPADLLLQNISISVPAQESGYKDK